MKIIVITGIDGTGKTTLAKNLAESLSQNGIPAKYKYARIYPVLSRFLMVLGRQVFFRDQNLERDYVEYDSKKKDKMTNPMLALGYTTAILIDYYLQLWFKFLPTLYSKLIFVVDRYLFDTLISDLAVHLNYDKQKFDKMLKRMSRLAPKPQLTILLDAPEEVAFARKDDVVHIDYLVSRRQWYLYLASFPEMQLFDSRMSPEKLTSVAYKSVVNTLKGSDD